MSGQPNEGTKREFFPQLTSVRFFAALIVVMYHYGSELTPHMPHFFKELIIHGYVGVSFFFILSGFILGANYYDRMLEKRVTKTEFWWARFSRIYPLYMLSIVAFLPRFLLSAANDPLPKAAEYAHSHIPEVLVVSLFALQTFASPAAEFLNSPTWSISTEIFFYLLLPFFVPLIAKVKSKQLLPAIAVLFLLAGVGPYFYHGEIFQIIIVKLGFEYTNAMNLFLNQFVRVNFLTRLPEFLIGVMAFRFYREVMPRMDKKWIYIVGVPLSLPFLYMCGFEPLDGVVRTILYSGQFLSIPFFLMVLLGLITTEAKALNFLKSPSWVLLGEASFALYLFHLPIKHFGQYLIGKALHMGKENLPFNVGLIIFSILLSIPIFKYFETPVRKKLTVWWKERHPAKI